MRVLLDFDGTLCPDPCAVPPRTPPDPAAVLLLRELTQAGHRIVILSCRAHSPSADGWRARAAIREVSAYLHRYEVPFDEILACKPHADAVIDERALPFHGNWRELARQLRRGMRVAIPRHPGG